MKKKKPTYTNRMVEEHLEASERVMKKVLSSKKNSINFLIKVGILDKNGNYSPNYYPKGTK
jgi:hypothetical protein